MNVVVISYSLTGNNEALAKSISERFTAKHIKIKEPKPRTMGTIVLDVIFNKTPKVQPPPETLVDYDLILFLGPIWMGKIATPLRAYLKYLKQTQCSYAFISISGGADGVNPKLESELKKIVGKEPTSLIDMHIVDLLPSDPKPTRKDTSAYKINNEDIEKLTNSIVKTVKGTFS